MLDAKSAFTNYTKLSYIDNDPVTKILLTTDASNTFVSTVIEQENSQCKPIAFFSTKLSIYSTFS